MDKIFILGLSRTASKLYREVLNRHPDTYILHEIVYDQFLKKSIVKVIKNNGGWDNRENIIKSFDEIYSNKLFAEFVHEFPNKKSFIEDLKQYEFNSWGKLLEAIIDIKLKKTNKTVGGGKNPIHFTKTKKALKKLEDLKVIYLLRDPRSIFASEIPKKSVPNPASAFPLIKIKWLQRLLILLHTTAEWVLGIIYYRINKNKVLLCKYEKLIDNPQNTFENVFNHVNLDFKKEYLDNLPVIQSSHKNSPTVGVNKKGNESWETVLNKFEKIWLKFLINAFRYHKL